MPQAGHNHLATARNLSSCWNSTAVTAPEWLLSSVMDCTSGRRAGAAAAEQGNQKGCHLCECSIWMRIQWQPGLNTPSLTAGQ